MTSFLALGAWVFTTVSGMGESVPAVAPEIVSAWKSTTGNAVLIFRYDGVYFHVQDDASRPGMERGSYVWNSSSKILTATPITATIVTAAIPGDATSEQVTVSIPSTSTSRFIRLKATR
jgi:hypothetical protein